MNARVRTAVLLLAALPVGALSSGALVLLPFSLDRSGDLREHVAFQDDGSLLFAGAGPGTPSPEPELLGTLPVLEPLAGDFGTMLLVLGAADGERVQRLCLGYSGNPLALARLAHRWRGVFVSRGGACTLRGCELPLHRAPDGRGLRMTRLSLEYGWYGLEAVLVTTAEI